MNNVDNCVCVVTYGGFSGLALSSAVGLWMVRGSFEGSVRTTSKSISGSL